MPLVRHPPRLILLSFFDGVGSAAVCLERLGIHPLLYISWETDDECRLIIAHHFPDAVLRQDVCSDNVDEVIIMALVEKADPDASAEALCTAGPPCPDFSFIKENAPGRAGPEGRKFSEYCKFATELEARLKLRPLRHLCENVVFTDHAEADHFSSQLAATPVAIEAADLGPINRPRLYWTRIKWSIPRTNPLSGQALRWGRLRKFPRLHVDATTIKPQDVWVQPSFELHTSVLDGSKKMPCLTTPSPDGDGRPPPKKLRGKVEGLLRQRWLCDGRQYAPWQYQDHAVVHGPHGEVQVPAAATKEHLHGFSGTHTDIQGVSDRSRHRMMANSWRLHVIQFLLLLMFVDPTMAHQSVCRCPHTSALQQALNAAGATPAAMGFTSWSTGTPVVAPAIDMWDHWDKSAKAVRPLFAPPQVEPGALCALQQALCDAGQLEAFRSQVVQDLRDMVCEWSDFTTTWMDGVAPHVSAVYQSSAAGCVQVPLFLHLVERCGHPGIEDLREDLTLGFEVIGKLHSGSGWLPRMDDKYTHPLQVEQLAQRNHEHIVSRLAHAKPDEHWETMLQDL